ALTRPVAGSETGAAVAQPNPSQGSNRSWCAGADNASADLRIHACTALIQSGEGTAQSIAVAFANRGHAYRAKGDYRHALEAFTQAIQLGPNLAAAFNGRGLAFNAMRDYERAIADFDEAVRHSPTFALALVNRGNAYRTTGKADAAMRDYDEALGLDP